jgi:hypothetical protein
LIKSGESEDDKGLHSWKISDSCVWTWFEALISCLPKL